jgi:hypothetical protein
VCVRHELLLVQAPQAFEHFRCLAPRGHAQTHRREHRRFMSALVATAAARAVGRRKSYEAGAAVPLRSKRRYPCVVTSGEAIA